MEINLRYVAAANGRLRTYNYDPPPGEPETTAVYDDRSVAIRDLRPHAAGLSLDREGFRIVDAPTAMHSFDDEEAIRRVYYREAEQLVSAETGATRAIVFDHTIRRRQPDAPRRPVYNVHNDYTLASGPRRVRELLRGDPGELMRQRFAIVNVWRPIRGPLRDAPLAVADAQSVGRDDFVTTDLLYPDRTGEYYLLNFKPVHRWFYAPAMERHEALLLKSYDSAADGRARITPHAAFEDPTMPPDALPRESIELRTLVFL